jgi:hypothetical protein
MHYHLSFHDSDGRIEDVREADLATGDIAIRWMQIVGWAWARHYDWSVMELMCQGRLVARMSVVHSYQQAATAIGQYVEGISRPPDISPVKKSATVLEHRESA